MQTTSACILAKFDMKKDVLLKFVVARSSEKFSILLPHCITLYKGINQF